MLGAYLLLYPKAKVLVAVPIGFLVTTVRLPAIIVLIPFFKDKRTPIRLPWS